MGGTAVEPCVCCMADRECDGLNRYHTPKCLWCGARLIQKIQRLRRPREEIASRCKAVLTDWVAYGHSEQQIRKLAKERAFAFEPIENKRKKK